MQTHQLFVENIKCVGCMNTITTALLKLRGVTAVKIFKDEDKVYVSGIAMNKEMILAKLASLGFPEKGSNNFLNKAKSFVSCALGRYSQVKRTNRIEL